MRPAPLTQISLLSLALLLLPLQPSGGVRAQEVGISAPITGVHYDVTFNGATARERSVVVGMSFDVSSRDPVLLSLPAWTPGSYRISYFARYVSEFGAAQGGAPITWSKADHDTWRLVPSGPGRIEVRFRYRADTLDNSMSWSRPDFLLFNGTNLFPYPEGQGFDWPATVTVHTEADWQVGTAMPVVDPGTQQLIGPPTAQRTYRESNYHDLVDHPFFVGRLEVDSAIVAGRWMRLVTYPIGSVSGELRRRIWTALENMTPPLAAVFGEVPWNAYNVMQVADSVFPGASGLEHKDSHVNIVLWQAVGHPLVLSLYAHELVHAWNVKRLRPADLVPYRYDAEQPTRLLWVSEGITDYYADLALVRGGITDSASFLATTEQKIRNVAALPPISMEDASVTTWVVPVDGTHYSYYDHGSLAGLLLDVLIRDGSNNARSLDDVMRELYNSSYRQGRGFSDDEWWATVERMGGRSFAEFRARYVAGRERLPYAAVLPLAGIRVHEDTLRVLRIGIFTAEDTLGIRVVDVVPGGSAADAGVQPGDYLLAAGEVAVTDDDFGARFRQRYAQVPLGSPLTLRVRRDGRELTLPTTLQAATEISYRLSYDPSPGARAAAVRSGILAGQAVTE